MFSRLTLAAALAAAPVAAVADWTLDKSHTAIVFEVSHLGFSNTTGFFTEFDADIDFDPDNLEATKVTFTIAADSVNTIVAGA